MENKSIVIKEIGIVDIILSVVLGIMFGYSKSYIETGVMTFNVEFIIRTILFSMFFIIVTILIRKILNKITNKQIKNKTIDEHFNSKNLLIKNAFIIFACWLPIIVMLYPGTFVNDSYTQIQSAILLKKGINVLSSNNPILDTFYMSSIILTIVDLTENWHLAMFCYVIINATITSLVFSYTIQYAKDKLKLNNIILLIILIFYCINPILPECAQIIGKDSFAAWLFVLFYVFFIEIVRTKGECFKEKNFILKFVLITVGTIFAKKVAFYVVIISLIFVLIALNKNRRKVIVTFLCVLLIFNFIVFPFFRNILKIGKSGKQEMLSLPFQTTARLVRCNGADVTEEEEQVLRKVLEYDEIGQKYQCRNADPVKLYTQKGEDEDYIEYLKVWAKEGIRNPGIYIDAINAHTAGWFSFSKYSVLTNMNWHNQIDPRIIPVSITKREEVFEQTTEAVVKLYDNLYKIPLLNIFLSYGFYATLLPILLLTTAIRNKNKRMILIALPIILSSILGCYLAPCSLNLEGQRYLYPLIYTNVITIAILAYLEKENNK